MNKSLHHIIHLIKKIFDKELSKGYKYEIVSSKPDFDTNLFGMSQCATDNAIFRFKERNGIDMITISIDRILNFYYVEKYAKFDTNLDMLIKRICYRQSRYANQVVSLRKKGKDVNYEFSKYDGFYNEFLNPFVLDAIQYSISKYADNVLPYRLSVDEFTDLVTKYNYKYMEAVIDSKAAAEENEKETFEMRLNYY